MSKLSQQGLAVYKNMVDNVTLIKRNQWATTNYTALIYGAIVFLHEKKPDLAWLLSRITILTGVASICLLIFFQWELRNLRKRLEKAEDYAFAGREREA
jgi:hypothetical protein